MTGNSLSTISSAVAPALGNHLWQSTLFAVIAGLLALLLRKNHARVRYSLWLAASLKFMVPFSLIVAMGSYWASPRKPAATNAGFYRAMEQVSQPFTQWPLRCSPLSLLLCARLVRCTCFHKYW